MVARRSKPVRSRAPARRAPAAAVIPTLSAAKGRDLVREWAFESR
jgi:hypothetical protein